MTTETTITASNVRPSQYGASGWDVDIEIGGLRGEVTLVRGHEGPEAFGDAADMWVSGDLLDGLRGRHGKGLAAALNDIEAAAALAVEASGVEPAAADEGAAEGECPDCDGATGAYDAAGRWHAPEHYCRRCDCTGKVRAS